MIQLLALADEVGWAYVRSGGDVFLLRPPYTKSSRSFADEQTVQRAVGSPGFRAVEETFETWADLITFVRQRTEEAHNALQQEIAETSVGEEFLEVAPKEDLIDFLDRVEHELLPNRKWQHANNLLLAMLKVERILTNPELGLRVAKLLGELRHAQQSFENQRRAVATTPWGKKFPLVTKRYGKPNVAKYAQAYADRGQVLEPV